MEKKTHIVIILNEYRAVMSMIGYHEDGLSSPSAYFGLFLGFFSSTNQVLRSREGNLPLTYTSQPVFVGLYFSGTNSFLKSNIEYMTMFAPFW